MKMYLPPRGEPSRRGFLKKGLLGGLVLGLGGGSWLFTRRSLEGTVPTGLKVLSATEYAVMNALVQRFVPTREGFPTPDSLGTTAACDGVLALAEESAQAEFKQLLMLFENALPNFLFGGRTKPFTQLTVEDQETVLSEWRDSRITLRRTGYFALRGLVMAAYYGDSRSWPALSYPGPTPGIHDPNAPVWKGKGEPRPIGNGTFIEPPPPEPVPEGGTP